VLLSQKFAEFYYGLSKNNDATNTSFLALLGNHRTTAYKFPDIVWVSVLVSLFLSSLVVQSLQKGLCIWGPPSRGWRVL